MNYKDLDPCIRRGIRTIVEYWEGLDNPELDINDDEDMDAGILQLIEDTCDDNREDVACAISNLGNRFFERFGYDFQKARIIKEKLMNLRFADELNHEYVIKLLKEFDLISCCLADLDLYPLVLIESLYSIALLEKHADLTQELQTDIWYIMSMYQGVPCLCYRKLLEEDNDYDYSESGFMSPEEREDIAKKKYANQKYLHIDEEIKALFDNEIFDDESDFNPEVYGCSVKVRFPNNRVYKYNCRFDEIEENDIVNVTGKMKSIKGIVIERFEMWDVSDYMEEIDCIIEE